MDRSSNSAPRRHSLVGAVCALSLLTICPVALAEEPAVIAIELPALPLQEALAVIGNTYGITVIAPGELVRERSAPPITGRYTPDEAVARLLNGSDLAARRSGSGAIVVAQANTKDQADNDFSLDLRDEIVVTGTKQNLTLQDTQTSVELYDAERIDREVVFELDDIFLRAPNVATGGPTGGVSIRGVARNGVGGSGTGNTSNIYVDGAPLSDVGVGGLESLWDVGQVEILRGPQSTVQGRNALAGAIVINTNDPTYEFEAKARARGGEFGTRQFAAVVSGPLIANQLAARIAVDYQNFDGDVVNSITREDTQFEEGLTLRGKILAEPRTIPGLRIDLQAEYVDTSQGDFNEVGIPVPANDPAFANFDPFGGVSFGFTDVTDTETIRAIGRIDYQLTDNVALVGIGTFEDSDSTREIGDIDDPTLFDSTGLFLTDSRTFSGEARVELEAGRWSGWIGGYYFTDDSDGEANPIAPLGGLLPFPVIPADSIAFINLNFDSASENYAVFGEAHFDLNEKWTFELGIRYDNETFTSNGLEGTVTTDPSTCIVAPFVPMIGGTPCNALLALSPEPPQSATFDALLPRGTITYNFDDLRSLSASVQRGYRAGGSFLRTTPGPGGTPVSSIETFDPEFITNYELAFRSQWFDEKLTANINAFYSDWTDQQVSIPGPTGTFQDVQILNAGAARLFGIEATFDGSPTDELNLFASVGFVDTKFTDFPFAVDAAGDPVNPGDPTFANLDGNEFPISPSISASAGVYYQHPLGVFGDFTVSYTGEQFSRVENLPLNRGGAFTLINMRAGYQNDNFGISAFVNNLLDTRVITEQRLATVPTNTGVVEFDDSPFLRTNPPRVVGVTVDLRY